MEIKTTKTLKNTSKSKKIIRGVGKFLPGDEKEVEDSIANQFENLDGWEVLDSKKKKTKTSFFSSEETKDNPKKED